MIDDIQLSESNRKDALNAKELANYGWRLNIIQAVTVLLITSVTGFIGSEFYNYWNEHRPLKNPAAPSTVRTPPVNK